jgi:hypothetical protein
MEIFTCPQQGDVFFDALVCDHGGYLIFASVYGRDSSIQQLLSRMHLSNKQDGIDCLTANCPASGRSWSAMLGDPKRLEKLTGQLSKSSLFGRMSHAWIFHEALIQPNRASRIGWLMLEQAIDPAETQDRCWAMVKQLSPIPLLEHWRDSVLSLLQTEATDTGPAVAHGRGTGPVKAIRIALPTAFEALISKAIKSGMLSGSPSDDVDSLAPAAIAA